MPQGLNLRYKPVPIQELLAAITPTPQQPEVIPDVRYDSATYLQAGSAQLNFFQNVNADTTLSNMELAGSFGNPWYLEVQKVFVDFLRTDAAAGSATYAGKIRDIELILYTGRATLTLTLKSKTYGPWPLRYFGSSGGIDGRVTAAAGPLIYQAGGTRDNGGFPINGAIILPPQVKFGWQLNGVSTAISADMIISLGMMGQLFRAVQ